MRAEDEAPPGSFLSWNRLYGVVIVYGFLVIGVLTVLSWLLDFGRSP